MWHLDDEGTLPSLNDSVYPRLHHHHHQQQQELRCDASAAYSHVFDFEKNFAMHERRAWVERHWPMTLAIAACYVLAMHALQWAMRRRKGVQLRPLLTLWNVALALFSAGGVARMAPELFYVLREHGLRRSVCDDGFMLATGASAFWSWLFVLSKVVELGDTAFIVLRKRPLLFLHWFHHVAALVGISYSYGTGHAVGRWVACMNYGVHAVMYAYFALRSVSVSLPRVAAVAITATQIAQMIVGFSLAFWGFLLHAGGQPCRVTATNSIVCSSLYLLNAILFVRFFSNAYLKTSNKKIQ